MEVEQTVTFIFHYSIYNKMLFSFVAITIKYLFVFLFFIIPAK